MAKRNSSQQFIPVKNIRDGVVVLKNGQLNMVLLVSSINFALKSEDAQQAILAQFQSLLNALDFSLQFYVQSRRLNIEPYLEMLAAQEEAQPNDLMRVQLNEYMNFIRTFTEEVDVMRKQFFVVVPYTPVLKNVQSGLRELFGISKPQHFDQATFREHKVQLEQRVALVEQGLNRIGLKTARLQDDELVELYYHLFNPGEVGTNAPHYTNDART